MIKLKITVEGFRGKTIGKSTALAICASALRSRGYTVVLRGHSLYVSRRDTGMPSWLRGGK